MKLLFPRIAFCALVILTFALPAKAQVESSDEEAASNDAAARDLFEAAELSVERGDYELALTLFQQSF